MREISSTGDWDLEMKGHEFVNERTNLGAFLSSCLLPALVRGLINFVCGSAAIIRILLELICHAVTFYMLLSYFSLNMCAIYRFYTFNC